MMSVMNKTLKGYYTKMFDERQRLGARMVRRLLTLGKKGKPGFNEIKYKGKPIITDKPLSKYPSHMNLILCKNQPSSRSFKLDMRYKVNRDFIAMSKEQRRERG